MKSLLIKNIVKYFELYDANDFHRKCYDSVVKTVVADLYKMLSFCLRKSMTK